MVIFELVYTSVAWRPFEPQEAEALVAAARTRNVAADVSGILLYRGSAFLQLLEGDETVVRATFERIRRDPRHEAVRIIRSGSKAERSFASWSMGYVALARTTLPSTGAHGLSSNGTLIADDDLAVLSLLERFRNGEWSGLIR